MTAPEAAVLGAAYALAQALGLLAPGATHTFLTMAVLDRRLAAQVRAMLQHDFRQARLPRLSAPCSGPAACGRSWRSKGEAQLPSSTRCTNATAIAPSPTAAAQRRTASWRTSPAANTPGMLVSR